MSKIERKYKDYYGNARSLFWMVRNEPQWAESRILCCESAEAELETLQAQLAAKEAEFETTKAKLSGLMAANDLNYAAVQKGIAMYQGKHPGELPSLDKLICWLLGELGKAREHAGKCVECGTWTCGYCGISDSEGKWHCKTCQNADLRVGGVE